MEIIKRILFLIFLSFLNNNFVTSQENIQDYINEHFNYKEKTSKKNFEKVSMAYITPW